MNVGAFDCRGMIGHRWTYVPRAVARRGNVIAEKPARVVCARCALVRHLGVVLDLRRALRVFREFRDG